MKKPTLTLPRGKLGYTFILFSIICLICLTYIHFARDYKLYKRKLTYTNTIRHHSYKIASDKRTSILHERPFVSTGQGAFIFGAVGSNSSQNGVWYLFKIYGQWYRKKLQHRKVVCCYMYDNGTVQSVPVTEDEHFWTDELTKLQLMHVVCSNPYGTLPTRVSVAWTGSASNYIEPFYPHIQPEDSFVVTTKVSHGNLSSDLIISWMEAYRYLGVDKVVTYVTPNLCHSAVQVLEYYAATGYLDLYSYDMAEKDSIARQLHFQSEQVWTDTMVALYDAFERYHGYTYFSMIDWDEFIIPSNNRTVKDLVAQLFRTHKKADGFVFKSQYFLTSVKMREDVVFLKRYKYRVAGGPITDRPKVIYKPALIAALGGSHGVIGKHGFKTYDCPPEDAFIRHYRGCVPLDSTGEHCKKIVNEVKDVSMATWARNIEKSVRAVKKRIFPES